MLVQLSEDLPLGEVGLIDSDDGRRFEVLLEPF